MSVSIRRMISRITPTTMIIPAPDIRKSILEVPALKSQNSLLIFVIR